MKPFAPKFVIALGLTLLPLTSQADTMLTAINPPYVNIPGVSQAVLATEGQILFVSGQVPIGVDGITKGGLVAQAEQVFANFTATLDAAGGSWSDVARVTFYIKDYNPEDLETLRTIRDKWITSKVPPASALIGVASLFHPEALIEIDGIAVLGKNR